MITLFILLICISSANALSDENATIADMDNLDDAIDIGNNLKSSEIAVNSSSELIDELSDASTADTILLEKGTYQIHDLLISKNVTLQGNGDPRDIIIDGEHKSSIFLIRNDTTHLFFKNITFINADVTGFGGAISMETGHVYVDNCHFINNTASVNAGGISNYGTEDNKGYLFVNNSLFVNNHADHDGGAITTCYANSDIYNCVFIGNSAHRDGGAIRVSVKGYGNVQDCIFMYNHADEWGGAYYSWSGTSNINRCIFLNNTAGTNGGAVMVSGDINLENSIIVNNSGGETGGGFYIQQPMYDAITVMNVHNNLITNNTSPYGKEIFISWKNTPLLYTKFNNNDWGDEDPNDSSIIDPDNVTSRSKVTSTIKSNLLKTLNLGLLTKYTDLIKGYFPEGYLDNIKNDLDDVKNNVNIDDGGNKTENQKHSEYRTGLTHIKPSEVKNPQNSAKTPIVFNNQKISSIPSANYSSSVNTDSNNDMILGNSTSLGDDNKAYELNETKGSSVAKQINTDFKYFIAIVVIVLILLAIGYKRNRRLE